MGKRWPAGLRRVGNAAGQRAFKCEGMDMRTRALNCVALAAVMIVGGRAGADDCQPQWDVTIGQPGLNDWVQALAVVDTGGGPALYAGGSFTIAGGQVTSGTAVWNGSFWSPLGGTVGSVFSLQTFDDGSGGGSALYAGGQLGGMIARWNGASWTTVGAGLNNTVRAMTVFDDGTGDALYAGGDFFAAPGQPADSIARWDGMAWTEVGDGLNGTVYALTVFDDGSGPALYAGGSFTRPHGGSLVNYIVKWDGASWSTVGGGMNGPVRALAVFNDGSGEALYAGGDFLLAGGTPANRVARWDGVAWSPLDTGVNAPVNTLTPFDDGTGPALFVGGFFSTAGAVSAQRIAKWNGTEWASLQAGIFGGDVKAMAGLDDGLQRVLYAGGSFTSAGAALPGQPSSYIASWVGCAVTNTPPTAVAGSNQSIHAGSDVYLDGSASFDDNTASGNLLYAWTMDERPYGSNADLTLANGDSAFAEFFADLPGTYVLSLVVTDEEGLTSAPSAVTISSNNVRPTAIAGENVSAIVGSTVVVSGANSFDADPGDLLSFSWSIASAPAGSTAILADADTILPSFVPDLAGNYTLELVVSDGFENSDPDSLVVAAITAADFAQNAAAEALNLVADLPRSSVTTRGNQLALGHHLAMAILALNGDQVALAEHKLNMVLERTDGCALRGSPDGPGRDRDWVTDCEAQSELYDIVRSALDALNP